MTRYYFLPQCLRIKPSSLQRRSSAMLGTFVESMLLASPSSPSIVSFSEYTVLSYPPSTFGHSTMKMHSRTVSSLYASDDEEHRGPFSDKVLWLTDQIASLSNEELTQMSAALRKKLGIPQPSSMVPLDRMVVEDVAAPQAEAQEKPVEKTSFDLKLEKFDAAQKIKVIKEVRAFTNLGLKEAKDLVEKIPAVIKTGVSKEEALRIVEKLKAVGADVVMD